jgi:hypothetical protein
MRYILLTFTLLLILNVSGTAIQVGRPESQQDDAMPARTPPTFPPSNSQSSTMPPDTTAPPPKEISNSSVEVQIRRELAKEDRLVRDNVHVVVTDDHVMLDGEVSDSENKRLVNQVAGEYAGTRTVVDNLHVRK